jgi:putative transposase
VSRYRFIVAEQAHYPIAVLCRTLGVARSGYDAWLGRTISARQRADLILTERIRVIHTDSRHPYGSPRVHAALGHVGMRCGRKRVARLMRQADLVGCRLRRRTRTTRAEPTHQPAPNLVARQFTVAAIDQLWVGDITDVPTWEGWLYLAVLLDAYSRRVVGWAMAEYLGGELTRDALAMALARRRPAADLVHHRDRGSQYTASAYQALLAQHGVAASMSRAGDCDDNALAESFMATLKTELIDRQPWPTPRAARRAIFDWIEGFYTRRRLHSALGYQRPIDFEEALTTVRLVAYHQSVHSTGASPSQHPGLWHCEVRDLERGPTWRRVMDVSTRHHAWRAPCTMLPPARPRC